MSLASAWSTRTVLWLLSKQTSTSLLTCWKKVVLGDLGESCFFIHSNHNKLLERAKHLCFTPYIIVCSSVMIKYIFLLSKPNVNDINMTVTNIYSTGREPMIVKLQWRLEGVSFSNAIFARAGSSFHLVWWLRSTIDSPVAAYLEFESDMVWVPHGLLLFVAPNQMLKLYKCFRLEQKCKINASMGQGRLAAIVTFKTVEARRDQEVPRNLQRFRCNYIHSSCGLCHQSWQTSAYYISAKYQIRLSWKSYFWTSHWLSVFYAFASSSAMKLRS